MDQPDPRARELWASVDRYITGLLLPDDPALVATLRSSEAAGLPAISVTPNQGMLLHLLALIHRAQSILEIGTLGGYSAIWLARALGPGGRLITLEADRSYAELARANIERAGLGEVVELIVGRAQETLPRLNEQGRGPFDLIFIDADKSSYPEYFQWTLKSSKVGTLIIADNVVRKGAVADPDNTDPSVVAVQQFNEMLAAEKRVRSTIIQTVGSKGYDGFALALVMNES